MRGLGLQLSRDPRRRLSETIPALMILTKSVTEGALRSLVDIGALGRGH